MSKLIEGTHHIALKAEGEAEFLKAVHFYQKILGMPMIRSWGAGATQGAMLGTGTSLMEIMSHGTDHPGQGNIRHFALTTRDVDACVKAVREAGYEITIEPVDKVIPSTPPFPIRIAFCIGPLGEEVEFFCER